MDKRYQVFISSTFKDLEIERQQVMKAILEEECFPAGMEMFPAANDEQFEFIKRIIDNSDYYVLIIAGRYGSLALDGISYTEKEFDYAVQQGIPILALLHSNPDIIPLERSEKSELNREKLQRFREKASTGRVIREWETGEQLKNEVGRALRNAFKYNPRTGWIRANEIKMNIGSNIGTIDSTSSTYSKDINVNEAKAYFNSKGIALSSGYSQHSGTNLVSGIQELEEGRVISFPIKGFDVVDNPKWYYYNVKNKVGYEYFNNKFTKV